MVKIGGLYLPVYKRFGIDYSSMTISFYIYGCLLDNYFALPTRKGLFGETI